MKIALCLHGYFDSSKDTDSKGDDGFNHIKKHILKYNDVDVYIHSWDILNETKIVKIYGDYIKDYVFEPQIDFQELFIENKLNTVENRFHNRPFWETFSQFYSVQRSFELLENYGNKYDVVIKSRFDLGRINRNTSGHGLQNPYPVQCINFQPELDMEKFYFANWQYLDSEGPPDMWFYSNMENMLNFTKFFDIVSNDIKVGSDYEKWAGHNDGGMLNVIKAWKWCLLKTKLWDKQFPLDTTWE